MNPPYRSLHGSPTPSAERSKAKPLPLTALAIKCEELTKEIASYLTTKGYATAILTTASEEANTLAAKLGKTSMCFYAEERSPEIYGLFIQVDKGEWFFNCSCHTTRRFSEGSWEASKSWISNRRVGMCGGKETKHWYIKDKFPYKLCSIASPQVRRPPRVRTKPWRMFAHRCYGCQRRFGEDSESCEVNWRCD